MIADPQADTGEAERLYGITFADAGSIRGMDAVILAVAHREFTDYNMEDMDRLYGEGTKVLLDVKGLLDRREYETAGYSYWRL